MKYILTVMPEVLVLILTSLLAVGMVNAGPRIGRKFCAHYPFAPRCLGVAAKRDNGGATKMSLNNLPDYGDLESLILRSKSDADNNAIPLWDSHDSDNDDGEEDDDNVNKAVIVPIKVLSKIIGTKPSEVGKQKKRMWEKTWMDYEGGRI